MMPQHQELYTALTPDEAVHLSLAVVNSIGHGDLPQPDHQVPEDLEPHDTLRNLTSHLSHAEVVLCLAQDTSEIGMTTIEKLIQKPLYLCARGETGEVFYDVAGNPLETPLGNRRGQPPRLGAPSEHIRERLRRQVVRHDNRVITHVVPNPKRPGSAAHHRFLWYKVGMTIDEVLAMGVTRADVRYDIRRGYIIADLPR